MPPTPFDGRALLGSVGWLGQGLRYALRWGAHHSGMPVVLVAAVSLVLSWRILKRTARLAVEVALTTALLLVATRLGWISW